MPEGDSLHRVAGRLQVLVGERLSADSPNPRGLATGVARAVDGRVLERVEAIGKNVLLHFEGGIVVRSHLRMNGRWRVARVGEGWMRRGLPWLCLRSTEWEATQWGGPVLALDRAGVSRLGPDILSPKTDPARVVDRLRRLDQSRLVGEALVDQRVVAGIGNLWLAECLWHAHVSPWARLAEIDDAALEDAVGWVQSEMRRAVEGRRSVRAAYRRPGRGCPRCGEPIRSRGLGDANRTAYWCPRCQGSVEEPESARR